ncbi:MAG: branched-chain amino acid ABC transporter permease [Microthrixaceae bacterium]
MAAGTPGGAPGGIVWWRVALWTVLAALAVAAPQVLAAGDVNRLSEVIYIAVAALGLALLTGFNGQISLGHGAFLGMGAYITMILTVDYDVSYLMAGIVAVVFTFVVGLVVGLPALRITGIYLALVTLALATLFPQIVVRLGDITGTTVGRGLIPREGYGDWAVLEEVGRRKYLFTAGFRAPGWTGLADDQWRYYVFLVLAVVCFLLVRNLVSSRVGRALVAIRDNETAAEVAGVHVSRYKVVTFGLSASIAAVGGWMFAVLNNQVSPTSFTIALSITLLVAAVLGGANSIIGPVIGAFIIVYLREAIPAENQRYSQVIFGFVLIIIMLIAPGGIVGVYRKTQARLRRSRAERTATPEPVNA